MQGIRFIAHTISSRGSPGDGVEAGAGRCWARLEFGGQSQRTPEASPGPLDLGDLTQRHRDRDSACNCCARAMSLPCRIHDRCSDTTPNREIPRYSTLFDLPILSASTLSCPRPALPSFPSDSFFDAAPHRKTRSYVQSPFPRRQIHQSQPSVSSNIRPRSPAHTPAHMDSSRF